MTENRDVTEGGQEGKKKEILGHFRRGRRAQELPMAKAGIM